LKMEWKFDGKSTYKTYIGAIITIIIVSVVLGYSAS